MVHAKSKISNHWIVGSTLFAYGNMIRYDPTLVDLTSNVFVLCTNVNFIYIIIHSGWSLT